MMSQQRTRKLAPVEHRSRGRSIAKAASDQCPPMKNTEKKQCGDNSGNVSYQKRSRSKLPKNLRNDLDNALVALCDVWFEEIKPYLVRNNIKVNAHGAVSGTGAASGDHRPADRHGCAHLDPASSAHVCELCQLLVNAANSIESAVSQAATAAPAVFNTSQSSPLSESESMSQQ